jgi:predicted nucleic acid-binding protein
MKSIFVDSVYWIAILKPQDPYQESAKQARSSLGSAVLFTSDEVLTEVLAALGKAGPQLRQAAARMVDEILKNPNVRVIAQTREGFLKGVQRYRVREDKQYSLTDCIAMNAMESNAISEILTNDRHFEQEGFTILMKRA